MSLDLYPTRPLIGALHSQKYQYLTAGVEHGSRLSLLSFYVEKFFLEYDKEKSSCISTRTLLTAGPSPLAQKEGLEPSRRLPDLRP